MEFGSFDGGEAVERLGNEWENTMMLVLWKYLRHKTHFLLNKTHLREFSGRKVNLKKGDLATPYICMSVLQPGVAALRDAHSSYVYS